MNILLINHYAGSPHYGMEYRPYYMAREWVRAGHRVRIVASAQSHVRAKQPALKGAATLLETIDGIEYLWFSAPEYAGNGLKRVWNIMRFVADLFLRGRDIDASFTPDVVIASSTYPMDIWPARRIAQRSKAKLVFEVHDLWPLSPMELGGMSKWHPFIMMVATAEGYAYRHADAVVSMLPKVRTYMESRGMPSDRLYIVPNGIDPAEWQANSPPLPADVYELLSGFKARGLSIVGYAGTHGVANAMDVLLDAAACIDDDRVVFVLVGGGPDKEALRQRAVTEQLSNVFFVDPVKKAQIPALLAWFDIAYIGWHRQPLYRFGISPNKLMDYMMAARPILHAVEAGNDPVGEAGCGLTVAPEDPFEIVRGIQALLKVSADERAAMGQRGRQFVLENHTYPVLARRFVDAFGPSAEARE